MRQNYSVLMPVYYKEKPQYLKQSMESIWEQSVMTDDFVLVCDGELTDELNDVIFAQEKAHEDRLRVVRLEENVGLGKALNVGIKYCQNELVARMDSDDVACKKRCAKQLQVFCDSDIDIVSATVGEFECDIDNIVSEKEVPETHQDIMAYVGKRNPFNHPAVMYRKSAVIEAGSYQEFPFFEDYFLWTRMLLNGAFGYNIQETLVYMRVDDKLYGRRGGWKYMKLSVKFRSYLHQSGLSSDSEFLVSTIGQIVVTLIPNCIRRKIYRKFLRKRP